MQRSPIRSAFDLLIRPIRTAGGVNRRVIHALMAGSQGRLLEFGAGSAPMLERLREVSSDQKYVIEFEGVLDHCRSLGYHCRAQDVGKDVWDFEDDMFDLVVSNQVIEHIPRTDHVFREAWRVLKPGGRLLMSTPNPGALIYLAMMALTLNPPMSMVSDEWYGLGNPLSRRRFERAAEAGTKGHGHLRLFSTRGMKDLLRVHGFRVITLHGGTWGVPLVGRMLAGVFPWYGLYTTVLAEKPESSVDTEPVVSD